MYDVAVIGGGPIGSRVAYQLAGMGYGVVVLEQKDTLGGPVCCTGIVSQECFDDFIEDKELLFRQANSAKIFSPSGNLVRPWRKESQACVINRPALNLAFAKRAQDRGAEYRLNNQVRAMEIQGDRVGIETGRSMRTKSIEAKVVVIASGSGSKLVEKLGFGKTDDYAIGVQAEVETNCVDEVEVYLGRKMTLGFFAWLVPTSPGRGLVGLLSRRRAGFYLNKLMTSLVEQQKIVANEAELSYAKVPLGPLRKTLSDRILVVGSAAGQVKPTTGGGIYYGFLCADIAANTLNQALTVGDLSGKSLNSYEKIWKKRLGRELQIGRWSRKFYEMLSDTQIDRIFNIILSSGIDKELLESDDLSFDWHGKALLKVIGHKALARTIQKIKLPFPSIKG